MFVLNLCFIFATSYQWTHACCVLLEVPGVRRSAEDSFISELVGQYIDKYAQYYIQYLKFKRLVTVEPLMPDQAALKKIKEIKAETKKNSGWLQEAHAELEIQIKELEDSKADAKSKNELDATEKEIENTR